MNPIELIEKYLHNTLSKEEKTAFEKAMEKDDLIKQLFHKYYLAHKILGMNQHLQLTEIIERIAAEERVKNKLLVRWSNKLLDILGIRSFFQKDFEKIVNQQFTPYLAAVSLMGDTESAEVTEFIQGIKEYDHNNYSKAVELLNQVNDSHPNFIEAQFYLGNAYLALQKPAMAIICFEEVLENKADHDYMESAAWYNSLALLKLDEKQAAHSALQKIMKESKDSYYRNKAAEMFEKLYG